MEAVSCGTVPATPAPAQKHKQQHKQQRHVHPLQPKQCCAQQLHTPVRGMNSLLGFELGVCAHANLSCCGTKLRNGWQSLLSPLSTTMLRSRN
jgi:hypothetical protein